MSRAALLGAAFAAGAAGLALTALGLGVDPRRAWFSYLTAYAAGFGVVVGALLLVMLGHVVRASWLDALRRPAETIAGTLAAFALLFVPVAFGLEHLYPWAGGPGAETALARHRAPYLNGPAFLARAALYLVVLSGLGVLLRGLAARQDADPSPERGAGLRRASAIGLPAAAFAVTFAAFDWLMSLEPAWHSTLYGLYYASGGLVAAIALVVLVGLTAHRAHPAAGPPSDAYESLGALLLAGVLVWGYVRFAQYLTVWSADIPREVVWYLARLEGRWGLVALVLLVGHLVLPALLLVPRAVRRRPAALVAVGILLLALHYVDVYWLVMPVLDPDGVRPHWLDLSALVGVAGTAVAAGAWGWRGQAALPARGAERAR